jgi:hypothetical protein
MLLLAACASDEFVVDNRPGRAADDNKVTFRISLAEAESSLTKALTVEDENRIDSLQVFVFEKGATPLEDLYKERIGVSGSDISGGTVTVVISSPTDEQMFILVANSPELTLTLQDGVTKVKDLIPQLKFSGGQHYNRWKTTPARFPMWGETSYYTKDALSSLTSPIDVYMYRAVAKVEVGVDINNPAGGDNAIGFGSIFHIDSVYLCNVNDSGYIAFHDTPTKTIKTIKVDTIGYKFTTMPSNVNRLMARTIYAPPTDSLIIENNDTLLPPYLVIKAKYYNEKDYYYRIDFTQGNNYISLLRNHNYTVNITGIRTVGYETLTKAIEAPILPINPHLILDNEGATAKIKDIIYTNRYWLGCEATDVKVDWGVTQANINVGTSYPDGWQATVEGSAPSGVTITSSANTLSVHYADKNVTGLPRTVKIKLTAGTLTQYINVTQSPGSHTYVTKAGTPALIPLASANIDGGNPGITSVEYYYDETSPTTPASDNISGNIAIIPISFINRAGKIIVTAFDNANDTVWAWSVWVVPAGVDFSTSANQRYYNGYTFMDRNLLDGANYQWGRKDPAIDTTHVFVPPTVDLQEVVKSPRAFYLSGTSPYNWLDTQHNNLWTTPLGEKGLYDPCPFGWRVPPAENDEASPWKGFTNGDNYMTLPTDGGINGTTGLPIEPTACLVWGASARGADAYLYNAGTGTHQKAHRTNAYPIRCVRDVKHPGGSLIIEN